MKNAWVISLGALALMAGCSTSGLKERPDEGLPNPEHHTIYIDRFGDVARLPRSDPASRPACDELENFSDQKLKCEEDYADAIINNFIDLNGRRTRAGQPPYVLTLYVHGGLNAFTGSTGRSAKFSADMLAEGHYPVFIAWDSGGPSNYLDHLIRIRKGEERPIFAPLTAPLVLLEDLLRSLARIPGATYKSIHDPLTVSKRFKTDPEEDFEQRHERLKGLGFKVVDTANKTGFRRDYWALANPLKLGTGPFIDGLGTGAWQSMLRRADLILSKSVAYEGVLPKDDVDPTKIRAADAKPPADYTRTVAAIFLQKWTDEPKAANIEVHLIGHSMGAIVATNILAKYPKLNISQLVYMGAAVRIKDVESIVVPWLTQHPQATFRTLSLDPYRELGENTALDSLPRGSLLNWIDFVFGDVHSFKDRTFGSWWNVIRAADDIFPRDRELRGRVHLVRFPIGGEDAGPQQHTQFDEYCFWREEFWLAQTQLQGHPDCARGALSPQRAP